MVTETTTTEVTEFEDGSKIVETKTVESEYIEGDNVAPVEAVEVVEQIEPQVEITEIVQEAITERTEIEAETERLRIEEQAETERQRIAAQSEGTSEWQRNIEAELMELKLRLSSIPLPEPTASLPPPSLEESAPDDPTLESPAAAASPPEPPAKAKRLRWI